MSFLQLIQLAQVKYAKLNSHCTIEIQTFQNRNKYFSFLFLQKLSEINLFFLAIDVGTAFQFFLGLDSIKLYMLNCWNLTIECDRIVSRVFLFFMYSAFIRGSDERFSFEIPLSGEGGGGR